MRHYTDQAASETVCSAMIEMRLVSHDVTKPRRLAAEDETKIAVCGPLPISDPVPVPQKETNRLGSTLLSAASLFAASHSNALAQLQAPPFSHSPTSNFLVSQLV